MAEYEDLDDATLQQKLSGATSYEERATLRQIIRKRKKERGETTVRSKSRGNSVYNRFAGSTGKSSKSGSAVGKPVPHGDKLPKQETGTAKKGRTVQSPATPTKSPTSPSAIATPPVTPDPQPAPQPPPDSPPETSQHETPDVEPVTPDAAEEEEEETEPVAEVTSAQDEADPVPEDHVKEGADDDELGLVEAQEEIVSEEHNQSTPQDATDSLEQSQPTASEPTLSVDMDLQCYLVAYVNQELFLDPPIPARGKALYDTCSEATALCKLINKAVPGTVDMRALSKISGSTVQRAEAKNDNMTLVIESARAIGCRISDATFDGVMNKDPETINNFLLDLIRAQVVHMPGMEDEPASTFSNLALLFQKLHISIESEDDSKPISWRDDPEKIHKALRSSPPGKEGSWRESKADSTKLTYEERAALRKAEREQRQKEKEDEASAGLTYEERAAQRKAERERRRREREALAK